MSRQDDKTTGPPAQKSSPRHPAKQRADLLLVERGLATTRSQAQGLLLAGRVYSGEQRVDKSGALLASDAPLELRGGERYVSRGGTKLEGALTDLRKSVVNATALAEVAAELHIGEHLLLGRGEDAAGGREKVSILSDAMEAVLGAVYLDGGAQVAFDLVERLFAPRLDAAVPTLDRLDYKSALQELVSHRAMMATHLDRELRSTRVLRELRRRL